MNEPLKLVANLEDYRISPGSIFSTYYIAGNRCGQANYDQSGRYCFCLARPCRGFFLGMSNRHGPLVGADLYKSHPTWLFHFATE